MAAALDWREQGPPRAPLRGDELARELGIEPGPELGGLLGRARGGRLRRRGRRPRDAGDRAPAARECAAMIVDCAVYEDGRAARRRRGAARGLEACRAPDSLRLDRPLRAHRGRSSTPSSASSTCTSWRSRTRSTPTSGPSSRSTATRCSWCSRPRATSTRRRSIEFGEILVFVGDDFIVTVRHGEASALDDVREQLEDEPELLQLGPGRGAARDRRPGRRRLRARRSRASTRTSTRSRTRSSPGARRNPAERIYKLKREVLEFHRATGAAGGAARPARRAASTTSSHPEVRTYFRDVYDHLLRAHDQLDDFRDLLTSVLAGQPHPGRRPPERGHAQDLGVGRDRRRARR